MDGVGRILTFIHFNPLGSGQIQNGLCFKFLQIVMVLHTKNLYEELDPDPAWRQIGCPVSFVL
jgi:hypothetical protein